MDALPLQGVTVLDFFWQIAGPLGSKALLELGARVIRVESASRPCNLRVSMGHPGGFTDMNHGGVLHSCNSCKESLAVNMGTPQGKALIRTLLPHVDVVTNNYTPNAMARWGLAFEDVVALNPRIVYVSLPAMGSTGPKKDWRAYGNHVNAISGLNAITGFEGDPMSGPGVIYADFVGNPFHAATAVVAGLEVVRRTGKGISIDIGQYEATATLLGQQVLTETLLGTPTPRLGNRHLTQAPHGVFPTAGWDRWIALSIATDRQWDDLVSVLGLSLRPNWDTFRGRKRDEDELESQIALLTRDWDGDELMRKLQARSVPAAVVQTLEDIVTRDAYMANEFFQKFTKDGWEYRVSGPAFHFAGVRSPVGLLADVGSNSEEILTTLGGIGAEEIADLRAANILE